MRLTVLSTFALIISMHQSAAQNEVVKTIIPTAHSKGITGLSVSPDGKYLLSMGLDATAVLWHIETAVPIYDFSMSKGFARSAMFSPDGKNILLGGASPSGPGVVATITDIASKKVLYELRGEKAYAFYIDYSRDGSLIAGTGVSGLVSIWEAATGKLKTTFKTPIGTKSIHFSEDGSKVILTNGGIYVYSIESGEKVKEIPASSIEVFEQGCPSPDNGYVVYAGGETVILYDLENGEFVRKLPPSLRTVTSLAYAPDNKHILIGSDDGTASYYDMASGKLQQTFTVGSPSDNAIDEITKNFNGSSLQVKAVRFSPDGKSAFVGIGNRSIRQYDLATGDLLRNFKEPNIIVEYLFVSPDKKHLYIREAGTKTVRHLDILTGKMDVPKNPGDIAFESAIELPGSKYQLVIFKDNLGILVYNTDTKKYEGKLYFHDDTQWLYNNYVTKTMEASPGSKPWVFTIDGLTTKPLAIEGNPKFKKGLLQSIFQ